MNQLPAELGIMLHLSSKHLKRNSAVVPQTGFSGQREFSVRCTTASASASLRRGVKIDSLAAQQAEPDMLGTDQTMLAFQGAALRDAG